VYTDAKIRGFVTAWEKALFPDGILCAEPAEDVKQDHVFRLLQTKVDDLVDDGIKEYIANGCNISTDDAEAWVEGRMGGYIKDSIDNLNNVWNWNTGISPDATLLSDSPAYHIHSSNLAKFCAVTNVLKSRWHYGLIYNELEQNKIHKIAKDKMDKTWFNSTISIAKQLLFTKTQPVPAAGNKDSVDDSAKSKASPPNVKMPCDEYASEGLREYIQEKLSGDFHAAMKVCCASCVVTQTTDASVWGGACRRAGLRVAARAGCGLRQRGCRGLAAHASEADCGGCGAHQGPGLRALVADCGRGGAEDWQRMPVKPTAVGAAPWWRGLVDWTGSACQ